MTISDRKINVQNADAPAPKPAPTGSGDKAADGGPVITDAVKITFDKPITLEDLGKLMVRKADGGFTLKVPEGATVQREEAPKP